MLGTRFESAGKQHMSIQMIARELYRLLREIESLEKEQTLASDCRRDKLAGRLRKLRAEYRRMRGILDGRKEPMPSVRRYD